MAPISAADIPTLSLLYKLKKLNASRLAPVQGATPTHNDRIGLIRGDITSLQVGAIVNAANNSLLGGGGVDGAIHRAAGPSLLAECRTLNGCQTGSSKITSAYSLPCKKVIHTVGPIYDDIRPDNSERALKGCYTSSLNLAVKNGLKTIAFSGISTGIYGYPSLDAAMVACETVKNFLDRDKTIDKVVFVTFEEKDVRAYNQVLPRFFPPNTKTSTEQEKAAEEQKAEAEAKVGQLPDVPTTDPADADYAQKKQKHENNK
ncbi:macro domain-containing protein [Pseudomassariella vexata]|uniref:Macro domain-containing protein n=1 Tax=Pseudomassariella vexata TaxID=1141098 RepID=A0A1Y2ECP0_9PEZI|nr:macro domain-containing protein [Pseudomassariella vexata]ORY69006.1 macro domain-containing protein [Pseudomassariella vexata]